MQKIFSLTCVLFFIASCKHGEGRNEFEIKGTIRNAGDKMVYLQETPLGAGERFIADSAVINPDGTYHLKAKASEESLFSLLLKSETFPFAYVINDASYITVNADIKNQNDYEVKGSAASKSLKEFSMAASGKWTELYWLGHQMDSLKKSGAADSSVASLNMKGQSQLKNLQDYVEGFIKTSPDPITSVWALGTYAQVLPPDDYQGLLNGIVTKFPNHKGVAAIKEMNDRQLAMEKQKSQEPQAEQWVNKQEPDLDLPDVNGHLVKLSSFKGKYVLVDIWASWCGPCRHENPNVVGAYNKYKNKNFTILGVSLDKEKDDWLNAIDEDKLSWTQVSDLKEWNSVAVSTFDINSIPFNVLIDPDGKVIAQSLRGEDLDRKLAEVLK